MPIDPSDLLIRALDSLDSRITSNAKRVGRVESRATESRVILDDLRRSVEAERTTKQDARRALLAPLVTSWPAAIWGLLGAAAAAYAGIGG